MLDPQQQKGFEVFYKTVLQDVQGRVAAEDVDQTIQAQWAALTQQ